MANFKNTVYDYYNNEIDTVPRSSTKTGTIETVGRHLIGTSTLFKTELPIGSWVFSSSQLEVRKVISVDSDVKAELSNAFTIDIAAASALVAISFNDVKVVSISVQIPSSAAADGKIDNKTLPKGSSITFSKDSRDISGQNDSVDPLIVTATGTVAQVMYQR
jgi:hypothetical protein